jgi:ubiquinone/menaquinone biosynthesis C-methylase UbiE
MTSWADWLRQGRFAHMTEAEREEALRGLAQTRDRVLAGARLARDDDVLDLGAGTGLLTFGARERIGDGWVIAVDPEVDNLEELLRGAHELGAGGISYLVGDAEVLPLPDAVVDVAMTRSVLMYVADVGEAARELFRVLRPGGRVSLFEPVNRKGTYVATTVDWTPIGDDLATRIAQQWEAHAAASPLMRLDDEELGEALRSAGFAEVTIELETGQEDWAIDERSVDARLDAIGAAGELSLRQRWAREFTPAELELLVGHIKSLAGTTLSFVRVGAWVTARKQ